MAKPYWARQFWWYSMRVVSKDGATYYDSVSRSVHPFEIQQAEQSAGRVVTILAWKEISAREYAAHGESVPISSKQQRARTSRKRRE